MEDNLNYSDLCWRGNPQVCNNLQKEVDDLEKVIRDKDTKISQLRKQRNLEMKLKEDAYEEIRRLTDALDSKPMFNSIEEQEAHLAMTQDRDLARMDKVIKSTLDKENV